MDESITRRKKFLINFACLMVGLLIYYFFFKYVIYAAFPFVLAAIVALVLRRPIRKLASKIHIPKKGAATIVLLLFYLVIVAVIVGIVFGLINGIVKWVSQLPDLYVRDIQPALANGLQWFEEKLLLIGGEYSDYLNDLTDRILGAAYSLVSFISSGVLNVAQKAAMGVPKALIATLFCIIATIFLTLDLDNVEYFILSQFSERGKHIIIESQKYIGQTMGHIIKSYAIILSVTFIELTIGLTILGVSRAPFYALLIAIFDVVPALGTGGIVIPWAVIELIGSNWKMALGLIIMYIIITVVRQTIEPKIVGHSIGLHPVLMLMSMYLGAKIFGVLGIIILPFTLVVLRNLNDSGRISLFKSKYKQEDKKNKDEDREEKIQSDAV